MLLRINGYPISAGFGAIDKVHTTPHSGVDIAVPEGTPLHAVVDGVITKVDVGGDGAIGRMVRMDCDGSHVDVVYGHMSRISVRPGDRVHAGDILGYSGNTGHSTGPHVHVQMIGTDGTDMDPTPFVNHVVHVTPDGAAESAKGIMDHLNGFSDWFLRKETELFVAPVGNTFKAWVEHIVALLNENSAEIITLGVVVCAAGMMIGPLIGNKQWFGRLFITLFGGVVWRMLT